MDFLPNEAIVNFVFPNEQHIAWSVLIVIYPYITGLIAGAFVVSALYKVFKIEEMKCLENFALITAFCFGLFAAIPLLLHLGQPQRAFNIYWTPHATSAMSVFGYVYTSYMILLMVEIWLVYRPFFIKKANESAGVQHYVWSVLTLGLNTYHPGSARIDQKVVTFLAGIGIPWACLLHGYVGFIFGSVKARVWWATPLQPLIFLFSAVVSGMAILLVMYTFIKWRRRAPYDFAMMKKYVIILWAFVIMAFTLETLEVLFSAYIYGHHWSLIEPLLLGPLFGSYIIAQTIIFAHIPFLLLGFISLIKVKEKTLLYIGNLASWMLLAQVLLMRFNVVIGGQMVSKSERGFVDFHWEFLSREGVLAALVVFLMPFVVYYILTRFIPIFEEDGQAP